MFKKQKNYYRDTLSSVVIEDKLKARRLSSNFDDDVLHLWTLAVELM